MYFTKLKSNEPYFSGFSTSSINVFVDLSNDNIAFTFWLCIDLLNTSFPFCSVASLSPTAKPMLSTL